MSELVRDWKAEKKDLEEAFDIIADKLVKADAEIERLNNKLELAGLIIADCGVESFKIKALITELCDALEECERFIHTHDRDVAHDPELLRRGRKATK